MKYMGSKAKIAKEILPLILKERKEGQWFVDLFCGGCNLLDKVSGKRIGNDKNKYLISMFKGLQENLERPYEITKEFYSEVRDCYNKKSDIYNDFMIGWVGFMGSFNGRFFDGGYSGKTEKRDYVKEQIKNTENQIPYLKEVVFTNKSYDEFNFKELCIIYCDIPYKDTKQYSTSKNFDYDKFWQWCRDMTKQGHKVFISEYNAPDDFKCIWSKEVTNSLNTKNTYKPVEKLFIYGN